MDLIRGLSNLSSNEGCFGQVWGSRPHPAADAATPSPVRARQRQTRLTPLQVEALVAAYVSGESLRHLAAEYGVHTRTVAATLAKAGVATRYRSLSPDDVSVSVTLYQSGQSLATIGERFHVEPHTIRRSLLMAGVTMRDSHGRARE